MHGLAWTVDLTSQAPEVADYALLLEPIEQHFERVVAKLRLPGSPEVVGEDDLHGTSQADPPSVGDVAFDPSLTPHQCHTTVTLMQRRAAVPASERRDQVIAVARCHFAERGYERTSMLALAEELEVDRVVLYRLFPNLAAIYGAVLAQVEAQLASILQDAELAALEEPLPARRIGRMLEVLVRAARSDPSAWMLLTSAPLDPEVVTLHRELRDRAREAVAGPIVQRARILRPEVEPDRVVAAAHFLFGGVEAALRHQIATRPPSDDDGFAASLGVAIGRFLGGAEATIPGALENETS